jgi:hypothetical protein
MKGLELLCLGKSVISFHKGKIAPFSSAPTSSMFWAAGKNNWNVGAFMGVYGVAVFC